MQDKSKNVIFVKVKFFDCMSGSAPPFESLGIKADVGVICSMEIAEFYNNFASELHKLGHCAQRTVDNADFIVILATPNYQFIRPPDKRACLVLLDGAAYSKECGFEYAFARLTTTDKNMRDAELLANAIVNQIK